MSKDKPYHTLKKLKTDVAFKEKVKNLLDALLSDQKEIPKNCIRWKVIDDIK